VTFAALWDEYDWRPIRGCPGRFVLASPQPVGFAPFGSGAPKSYRVPKARDEVLVARFADGCGLISYRRDDGSILHTLNTAAGLARKLDELGIVLDP
jgi:hypothetical protein